MGFCTRIRVQNTAKSDAEAIPAGRRPVSGKIPEESPYDAGLRAFVPRFGYRICTLRDTNGYKPHNPMVKSGYQGRKNELP